MNAPVDVTNIRIETQRLILRPWQEADLQDMYEYARVPGVGEMAGWAHHKSVEDTRKVIRSFVEGREVLALELKESGKAVKIGFSYHDGPELLDTILTSHPEIDIVQIQINYLDWNSESLQAAKLYDVAVKHKKEVIIMEPVKGGSLANLPADASAILKNLRPTESIASWAIRFASSLEHVTVVLSGMNTMDQLLDNMRDLAPVTSEENEILEQAADLIRTNTAISCTSCSYCTSHCPMQIPIPRYFAMYNDYKRYPDEMWKMKPVYREISQSFGAASACIRCRSCEQHCPQNLMISNFLKNVAESFE